MTSKGQLTNLTPKVELPTSNDLHKRPRKYCTHSADCKHTKVQGRGLKQSVFILAVFLNTHGLGGYSSLLQKVRCLAHERGSTCVLYKPNDAGDLGTTQIDALEAIYERGTRSHLLLHFIGV